MSGTLTVEGITFTIRRSAWRRTLGITVDRSGELIVHVPGDVDDEALISWTRKKLLWVQRKLLLKEDVAPKVRTPEYVSGESFSYLGRNYPLKVVDHQNEALRFDGARFWLRRDARPADAHFRRWYIATGRTWLPQRIEFLQHRTGRAPSRVMVRDLGFHWGSCGRDGTVYINWRVLQLPVRLVDYVLVHELCHLIEPHHRLEFWCVVERALPDWQDRKNELHRAAASIYWCAAEMRS